MFAQGSSILGNMAAQGELNLCFGLVCLCLPVLQKAQKKMLDVINSVGLSSSVLKMIERRHKNDLYMALGGMVGSNLLLCDWSGDC
jgi:hypothetical protein